jgi:ATP-binding cassette, subfamily C, bacterial LapB
VAELLPLPCFSSLQLALARLSSSIGNGTGAAGIVQGLPLEHGRLLLDHLDTALERSGLSAAKVSLVSAKPHHCPLLLVYGDGRAAIIAQLNPVGHGVAVLEDGSRQTILVASLSSPGLLGCWSMSPQQMHDDRHDDVPEHAPRHWLLKALLMQRDIVPSVVVATVALNLLALAVPLISMNVMDRVVSHAAFETLWALTLGGVIAVAADFLLRSLRGRLIDRSSARSDVAVSNRIFSKVLGGQFAARQASVGVQSNTLREYESLREISNATTVAALGDLPFAFLFLLTIYFVAGHIVWVPVAVMPLLLLSGWLGQNNLQPLSVANFRDAAQKNAVAVEVLSNLETVKSRAAESWAAGKWERAVASHLRHSLGLRWHTLIAGNSMVALQGLTTLAVLVAGVYLISDKQMSPGALFATTMLTGRALAPVAQLAGLLSKLHHAGTAYASLKKLVDIEQERAPDMRFVAPAAKFKVLQLENLGLSYSKDANPVLQGVSLTIRAGERIGIIGGIGSGKSSLLRAIIGLRPLSTGVVSLDGIPIQQIDPALYRQRFGVAFREEGFFFGTLRENVAFHCPEADDASIIAAAETGGAMAWIKPLPKGLDSIIGEAGAGLSSGQRQTLALSRAFVGNADVYLLDEPTSDVDGRTEQEFVQRLKELPAHKTLIAVTHRPAVIEACNRLIVIDQGRVVLDGDTPTVLARIRQQVQAGRGEAVA